MGVSVEGLVDWWIRPELRDDAEQRWRSRFLVHVSFLGIAISLGMFGYYALTWVPVLMAQCLGVALVLAGALGLFKRRGTFRLSSHLALGSVTTAFIVPPLVERELDPSGLAWFSVIPFVAALLLGARATWKWVAICVAAIVLLYFHPLEWGFISLAPEVRLVRNLMLLLTILAFALSFQSRQREVRHELERANRAKSSFLANMSHELRTPMNGVLGLIEVVLRGDLKPAERAHLELAQRSGRAMVALVNSILDVAKIEAGKLTLERTDFSLAALLDDLEQLYRPVAHHKGLQWRVARPTELAGVSGDALRLRQVLTNLVDNALKFTERGEVTLEVSGADGRVRFVVHDTGPGISEEASRRLFQPFEQADVSTTRRFGGTGLGLALAFELVELMGGCLALAPRAGEGSTFAFEIPLPRAELPVAAPPPAPQPPARAQRGRVLVVDDNAINLRVASALVSGQGFEVREARDGQAALECLAREHFDLVLMDCHMPVMDGLEATRAAREAGRTVPIVALTAAALPEELAACREAGMNDCLTKPINPARLAELLGSLTITA